MIHFTDISVFPYLDNKECGVVYNFIFIILFSGGGGGGF